MTPYCSVMIPSRKRVRGLFHTISRVMTTATGEDFEILVRLDEDDPETVAAVPILEAMKVRCFIGSRLNGYRSLDEHFYAQLENESRSPWVWIAGDDMDVQGDWFGELRKVPQAGFIVQPEISQLNASVYPMAPGQAFPIFPKHCWKPFSKEFPRPFDSMGDQIMRKNGWQTWFLKDVRMIHNEASPAEIHAHRNS